MKRLGGVIGLVLAVAVMIADVAGAASRVTVSAPKGKRYLWASAVQADSSSFALETGTAATCTDTVGPIYMGDMQQAGINTASTATSQHFRVILTGTPAASTSDSCYAWPEYAMTPNGPWFTAAGTDAPPLTLVCGFGTAGSPASNAVAAADPVSGQTVYTGVVSAAVAGHSILTYKYLRLRMRGDNNGPISSCKVRVSYISEVPPASLSGVVVEKTAFRRNKWRSAVQSDSIPTFTLEGVASATTTYSASDTVGPYFIGNLFLAGTAASVNASLPPLRLQLTGTAAAATVDTLFAWSEFSFSENGPWYVSQKNTAPEFLLVPGVGADGTAVGQTATTRTVVFSGAVVASPGSPTGNYHGPYFWPYVRYRLRGDGSSATAGVNSVFGCRATVNHVAGRAPMVPASAP